VLDHQTGLTLGSSVGELGTVMLKVQSRVPKDGGQCHVRLEVRDTRLGYLSAPFIPATLQPASEMLAPETRNRGVVIG
jgi:hypothetical protein